MKKILLILLCLPMIGFGQSKKEQIANLNKRVDSLNIVLSTTRESSTKEIRELKKNATQEIGQLNTTIEGLNSDNSNLKSDNSNLNQTITELKKVKDQSDRLVVQLKNDLAAMLDSINMKNEAIKNYQDNLENTLPSNALFYNQSSGLFQFNNSLNKEISSLDNYTEKYCNCLEKVSGLMNENRDYDEAMGSYGIDGYAQLSKSEKRIQRAKGIMLYNLSPSECSSFGDPYFYDVLFSEEVLNLCGNIIR